MALRQKKIKSSSQKIDAQEGLARPYGLAVPTTCQQQLDDKSVDELRCPSCGRKIPTFWKSWDSLKAWYTESYRLLRCRKCGTRFSARRKPSTNI